MNNYLATFYTHYGAIKFHNECVKNGTPSSTAPVPRKLSSSCGICVKFESDTWRAAEDAEDMEACYRCDGAGYVKKYAAP